MRKSNSKSNPLTARQELFAQHFALSGNGARAAIASGCKNYDSARVRASRWLSKSNIRARIHQIRDQAFSKARKQIGDSLETCIAESFFGRPWRDARRALALIRRLGIFEYEETRKGDLARLSPGPGKFRDGSEKQGSDAR